MMPKSPELKLHPKVPPSPNHPPDFCHGSLSSLQGEKAAEGLRQRKKLPLEASEAPLEGKDVKEGEDRCPISGKQGAEGSWKKIGEAFFKDQLL